MILTSSTIWTFSVKKISLLHTAFQHTAYCDVGFCLYVKPLDAGISCNWRMKIFLYSRMFIRRILAFRKSKYLKFWIVIVMWLQYTFDVIGYSFFQHMLDWKKIMEGKANVRDKFCLHNYSVLLTVVVENIW